MDLPTYTNIWRIEKRLYKLYDFRLPMPLPVGQIAVFTAIALPYVVILTVLGLPFSHTSFWLYVLPPGVLAWLATRPVLESKRLPELIVSQVRYLGEPRSWCRLAPLAEKDQVVVVARVWRRAEPAAARGLGPAGRRALAAPKRVAAATARLAAAEQGSQASPGVPAAPAWPESPALRSAAGSVRPATGAGRPAAGAARPAAASYRPAVVPGARPPGAHARPVPAAHERAPAAARAAAQAQAASPAPVQVQVPAPGAAPPAGQPPQAVPPAAALRFPPPVPGSRPPAAARPSLTPPPAAHHAPSQPPAARPSLTPPPAGRAPAPWPGDPARPSLTPLRAAGPPATPGPPATAGPPPAADPQATPSQPAAGPSAAAGPPAAAGHSPAAGPPAAASPPAAAGAAAAAGPSPAGPPAVAVPPGSVPPRTSPVTVTGDRPDGRPLRVVERALREPAGGRGDGWHDRVVVVPGGHRPGRPDFQQRDRTRAQLPVAGRRRIVVLGCTVGAGQTMTTLMTGEVLASLRTEPVAVLDLNPGRGSLAERAETMPAVAAGAAQARPDHLHHPEPSGLAVISSGPAEPGGLADEAARDVAKVFELLSARYGLTLADPGAAAVPRVLAISDQLVLVAPASQDAARAIAMTLEWLDAHGHAELARNSAAVINGVSRPTMTYVEQAEAVARGRCRAIVRVPWDDQLKNPEGKRTPGGEPVAPLARPGGRLLGPAAVQAYTALAGVLVAGLAAAPELRRAQL